MSNHSRNRKLSYIWNAGGLKSVVVRRLVATRPDQEANFRGANYGWQKFIGALERVVAGLE